MLRVGLIAPCVGIGGADALMLGLVRYAHNLKFTGAAIVNPVLPDGMRWTQKMCGNTLKIHQAKNPYTNIKGIHYYDDFKASVEAACSDADIVLSWCVPELGKYVENLDLPIIDYAQNSDQYAKEVIDSNLNVTYYYAACSMAASKTLPETVKKNIIYNGIDPGRVAPRIGRVNQRKVWGLSDKKIMLFMGRFVDEKHPTSILAALTYLPEEWVAVFVGTGQGEKELQRAAQVFCPGRVYFIDPQYHVGDILAAGDVFVLPSDFEGHSLALCEAWLAGIPTVFTDFEVMYELQEQFGLLGVMIQRLADGPTIAKAVLRADEKDDEIFAIVGNAKTVVWEHFTLPAIASIWEEFIDTCVFDWNRRKRKGEIHPLLPLKLKEKP